MLGARNRRLVPFRGTLGPGIIAPQPASTRGRLLVAGGGLGRRTMHGAVFRRRLLIGIQARIGLAARKKGHREEKASKSNYRFHTLPSYPMKRVRVIISGFPLKYF